MLRRKRLRDRGKPQLSQHFKKLGKGDYVAIKRNLSYKAGFHKRMQGKTGLIIGKRGKAYIINIKDGNKNKQLIVNPIHLKKIKTSSKSVTKK